MNQNMVEVAPKVGRLAQETWQNENPLSLPTLRPPPVESSGPSAWETLRQWTWVNSMDRFRPPPIAVDGEVGLGRGRHPWSKSNLRQQRGDPYGLRDYRYAYDFPGYSSTTGLSHGTLADSIHRVRGSLDLDHPRHRFAEYPRGS